MSLIEQNLLSVCKISKLKKGETRESYRERLARAGFSLPEIDWEDKLTNSSQEWVNSAIQAVHDSLPVPDFPDIVQEVPSPEPEVAPPQDDKAPDWMKVPASDGEATKKAAKPPKKGKKAEAPKTPAPAPVKAPAKASKTPSKEAPKEKEAPKAGSRKGFDLKAKIKELLIEDAFATCDDIFEKLTGDGLPVKYSTVQGIRAEFRHSLKFLKAKGLIEIDI